MTRRSRLVIRPRLEALEIRAVLSSLTPAQLTSAYGLNAVTFSSSTGSTIKGDGTGQTIAIIDVDHDVNLATELATFDARYGIAPANLAVANFAGNRTDSGWSEEEALDVEWAHAVAPAARLLVVEAASASASDLLAAVNYARSVAGVSVVSMSWGTSEFAGETSYDSTFTTPAGHTGITFLASSGDSGAGSEWPASSINVVAVGGTSLSLSPSGSKLAESAWSGSGGGYSSYEAEPSYQTRVQATGRRGSVDVALDADPNTGVSVYSVAGGGWIQVGGTSLSAPVWAGLIAIADQGRAVVGKATLDGATQTLADLYAAPAGSFNDITSGSRASTGYDTATGLGTPNATTLVAALVADPAVGAATATGTTSTGTTTTTTTGSGATTTTTGTGTTTTTHPTRPRYPIGGWWSTRSYFGYSSAAPQDSWSLPSTAKNAGQSASKASTPSTTSLVRSGTGATVSLTPRWATHRAVDVVLAAWSHAATG